ncbi:phage tail protein [Allokutzneria sp. NRRL B-24872]|uniref:phage tail protein n=1 Tax=Allokutzneria sp. NRRL B-24872 TaxID=1137961 RepID=UPI000A3A927E|nr:phage tail protein [Allokutzneria sp. NRRL B-24872]
MTRGAVPGLTSPHPLGKLLPGVYQEDEFAMRFTAGLDDVLAPVLSTMDNFVSYVDPLLTPEDFLDWLASWVGVVPDERLPQDRRRRALASAIGHYRWRGTLTGIRDQLATITGHPVEVVDSGGVLGAISPGEPLPGEARPWIIARIPARAAADRDLVDSVLAAVKPAHVPHRVEVVDDARLP